jgi:hypothetical protein
LVGRDWPLQYLIATAVRHLSGVRSGLVAVYQHYDYRPERRAAPFAWAEHVKSLVVDFPDKARIAA